jgi:hypothetical protein
VLDGALAMAVPTKFGQRLEVSLHEDFSGIRWEAKVLNKGWLQVNFGSDFLILYTPTIKNWPYISKVYLRKLSNWPIFLLTTKKDKN